MHIDASRLIIQVKLSRTRGALGRAYFSSQHLSNPNTVCDSIIVALYEGAVEAEIFPSHWVLLQNIICQHLVKWHEHILTEQKTHPLGPTPKVGSVADP